jgi:hypothetical protein
MATVKSMVSALDVTVVFRVVGESENFGETVVLPSIDDDIAAFE